MGGKFSDAELGKFSPGVSRSNTPTNLLRAEDESFERAGPFLESMRESLDEEFQEFLDVKPPTSERVSGGTSLRPQRINSWHTSEKAEQLRDQHLDVINEARKFGYSSGTSLQIQMIKSWPEEFKRLMDSSPQYRMQAEQLKDQKALKVVDEAKQVLRKQCSLNALLKI